MGQEGAHGDPIGLYRTGPPPSALGSGNEAAPEAAAPAGAPDSAGGSLSGGSLPGGSLPGTSTAGRVQSRGAGVRGTPPRTRVSLARGSRHALLHACAGCRAARTRAYACYTPARGLRPLPHVQTRVLPARAWVTRCSRRCERACYVPVRGTGSLPRVQIRVTGLRMGIVSISHVRTRVLPVRGAVLPPHVQTRALRGRAGPVPLPRVRTHELHVCAGSHPSRTHEHACDTPVAHASVLHACTGLREPGGAGN